MAKVIIISLIVLLLNFTPTQAKKLRQTEVVSFPELSFSFSKQNIQCTLQNCPTTNGTCVTATECKCVLTNLDIDSKEIYCDYVQKNAYLGLSLELLLPFGVGLFYTGNKLYAIYKAVFVFVILAFQFIFKDYAFRMISKLQKLSFYSHTSYILAFLLICWQIFDLYMLATGKLTDSNGYPLYYHVIPSWKVK